MKLMLTDNKKNWILAIAYVLFIYATLSTIRGPVNFLRSHNLLRLTIFTLYLSSLGTFIILLLRSGAKELWRYAALVLLFSFYALMAQKIRYPEEQIHFIEYGLVGIFFLRALAHSTGIGFRSYALALLLGSFSGYVDELIQKYTPGRFYDLTDVWLNALSVSMGLLLCMIFPSGHPLLGTTKDKNTHG